MDTFVGNSAVQTLVQVVVNFKTWLYLFAAFGVLIALRALYIARREYARALFGLEREAAANRFSQAVFALLLMLSLGGGVYAATTFMTPQALAERAEVRARVGATATAQFRATVSRIEATRRAGLPTDTPAPPTPTATPEPPPPTDTPRPPDVNETCHGEGEPLGTRYVDRQAVNLRRSPELQPANVERVLPLNTPLCVYADENGWLKVTVAGVEGYRYMLREFTRE